MTIFTDPPTAQTDQAVYTVLEVARLFSLSRGTAYAMVRNGSIPAVKLGECSIIPKTRLHDWLDGPVPAPDDQGSSVGGEWTGRS